MNHHKSFDMWFILWPSQVTYIHMFFYIWPTAFALTFYWWVHFTAHNFQLCNKCRLCMPSHRFLLMSQYCQLLMNGNIVVSLCTVPKIILQSFSSVYTAHKFVLSNEYEATAMPDTSLEVKECCQFLRSWPMRALPSLTFTQVSL